MDNWPIYGRIGMVISMNWRNFILTPRVRTKIQHIGTKIPIKQLGLSTGKIVIVRHLKFRALGKVALIS